jgi:hypothetical protein
LCSTWQFVAHYATWLIAPALLGIIPFGFLVVNGFTDEAYEHPAIGCFAVFVACWAVG